MGPLVPNHELREYNPCHSPHDGRFVAKNQDGRCRPEVGAWRRKEAQRLRDARSTMRAHRVKGGPSTWEQYGDYGRAMSRAAFEATLRVRARRANARSEFVNSAPPGAEPSKLYDAVPSYLAPDARKAFEDQRAVVLMDPYEISTGSAQPASRTVRLRDDTQTKRRTRAEVLSALRHEVGHIDPVRLGRTATVAGMRPEFLHDLAVRFGRRVDGVPPAMAADRYVRSYLEEVRAWRNAIRASGRVSGKMMRDGLGSYARGYFGNFMGEEVLDNTMAHLQRYGRMVRRARRKESQR